MRRRMSLGLALLGEMMVLSWSVQAQTEVGGRGSVCKGAPTAAELGWHLGVQAWSFNKYTFFESVDRVAALGLHTIEMFPGQSLSKEKPGVKTNQNMAPETMTEIKQRLASADVRVAIFGVTGIPGDDAGARKLFEWAKAMGIETICSEPPPSALPTIDKLCQEYGINVALHNHPKPSKYWNPDTVLSAIKGLSKHMGACADTGHWMRSDIDPVEALRKLEGRIVSFHFKDLNKYGRKGAHDVPWGTGKGDVRAMLAEVHRQGFKGVFSIEYEHNWDKSLPEMAKCVEYFESLAVELKERGTLSAGATSASPVPPPAASPGDGWFDLLGGMDLNANWQNAHGKAPGAGWAIENGELVRKGKGGYIWTRERFADFVLELEFNTKGNSGVFFRTDDPRRCVQTGIEMQVHKPGAPGKHGVGAIYDCLAPSKSAAKEGWNQVVLTANDNKITIVLNGEAIIDMDLNQWDTPNKNPDGSKNKFRTALKDLKRDGHIGVQDHGSEVRYRNIRIKRLETAK